MSIDIKYHIDQIEKAIGDAKIGLPDDIFYFISRCTPLINVDLLIKDENENTLLTWRDDEFYKGWHIPGGIIRFKEHSSNRIDEVARKELNTKVTYDETPLTIKQLVCERDTRGHFISMLYNCKLDGSLDEGLRCEDIDNPKQDQWAWHKKAPHNLLTQQKIFSKYIGV